MTPDDTYTLNVYKDYEPDKPWLAFQVELLYDGAVVGQGTGEFAADACTEAVANGVSDPGHHG